MDAKNNSMPSIRHSMDWSLVNSPKKTMSMSTVNADDSAKQNQLKKNTSPITVSMTLDSSETGNTPSSMETLSGPIEENSPFMRNGIASISKYHVLNLFVLIPESIGDLIDFDECSIITDFHDIYHLFPTPTPVS